MRLCKLHIRNYRCIVDSGEIRVETFQALVGENNAGKSNILKVINVFLSAGAGGTGESDFFDRGRPIVITATFTDLAEGERRGRLRQYLIGSDLILEKHLTLTTDPRKTKVAAEYHGYMAQPRDWWLSVEKIQEQKGSRPNWQQIAEQNGILEYVQDENGRVNNTKASYQKGLDRLLEEREDIEFDEPQLGETQALGIPQDLLRHLPRFYLLPAITDYSDEIDKRSSSSVFRSLMADLAERLLRTDPGYKEIEESLQDVRNLLNPEEPGGRDTATRLAMLGTVEGLLKDAITQVMPSVKGVKLQVILEETQELFSRGVLLQVDDGVMTDVLLKGHGLQRCVVFGLLQTLIKNAQGQLVESQDAEEEQGDSRAIILGIEEPELYIHPQLQRLIFRVLKKFADYPRTAGQVVYSTHSPAFVSVGDYHLIGVTRKDTVVAGTKVHQCEQGVLRTESERKDFQFLNSFGLEQNEMFFAQKSILVEGEQDRIAILAIARSLGLFVEYPEEIGHSVVVCGNKEEMLKFQKLLNAFALPYAVWLELDGRPNTEGKNGEILGLLEGNKVVELPDTLEELSGHSGHFHKTYDAKKFFENSSNIPQELKDKVKELFEEASM